MVVYGKSYCGPCPDPFAGSTVAPYGEQDTSYFEEVNIDFLVRDHSALSKQLAKFQVHSGIVAYYGFETNCRVEVFDMLYFHILQRTSAR